VALFLLVPAWAGSIQLDNAEGIEHEGKLDLDARFRVTLDPVHENALLDGVPLTFVVEFTLTHPRWYWAARRVSDWFSPSAKMECKLYYHSLTRTYRTEVGTLSGTLHQSYDTLSAALRSLCVASDWEVGQRGAVTRRLGSKFGGVIRMRLDKGQLPKPMQLSLLGDSDWNLDSGTIFVEFEESK
jgi:hypothetical protein